MAHKKNSTVTDTLTLVCVGQASGAVRGAERSVARGSTLSWSPRNSTVTGTSTLACVGQDVPKTKELLDGHNVTVGAKALPLRGSVIPAQGLRAPRREHLY